MYFWLILTIFRGGGGQYKQYKLGGSQPYRGGGVKPQTPDKTSTEYVINLIVEIYYMYVYIEHVNVHVSICEKFHVM